MKFLQFFVVSRNQIIKQEELEKRVLEDNGAVVGVSLDTCTSNVRKN